MLLLLIKKLYFIFFIKNEECLFVKVDRRYIYRYLYAIHEFEKFISKVYKIKSTDYKVYEGYLIKYEDYEKIKSQIHYKDLLFEGKDDINFSKEEFQNYVKSIKSKTNILKLNNKNK